MAAFARGRLELGADVLEFENLRAQMSG